jgi:Domain of unknown function (DUF4399)
MRHAVLIAAGLCFSAAALAADAPTPDLLHPQTPAGAKVFIISPKDGATVGQDVEVKFGVAGIAIAPATDTTTPNTGHHHLLVDVPELPLAGVPVANDATHKHYGKGQTSDTLHLAPGDHTLQLEFANAAHVPFEPALLSDKITIHVK